MDDVTTHPATAAMVDEYVAWYAATSTRPGRIPCLRPPDEKGQRHPLALTPPETSDDLRRLGRAISAVHFLTGGNMTHTPGYGALIALGMVNVLKRLDYSAEDIAAAESYRDSLAETGRFLTFAGGGRSSAPGCGGRERPRGYEAGQRNGRGHRYIRQGADAHNTPFAEDLLITSRTGDSRRTAVGTCGSSCR